MVDSLSQAPPSFSMIGLVLFTLLQLRLFPSSWNYGTS